MLMRRLVCPCGAHQVYARPPSVSISPLCFHLPDGTPSAELLVRQSRRIGSTPSLLARQTLGQRRGTLTLKDTRRGWPLLLALATTVMLTILFATGAYIVLGLMFAVVLLGVLVAWLGQGEDWIARRSGLAARHTGHAVR